MVDPVPDPETSACHRVPPPYPLGIADATGGVGHVEGILLRLGIGRDEAVELRMRTEANGSALDEEIVAAGFASEGRLADLIAEALSLPREAIDPEATVLRDARGGWRTGERHLCSCDREMRAHLHLAPPLEALDEVAERLASERRDTSGLRVTTAGDIRLHRARASRDERSARARLSLAADRNSFSARETMRPLQASLLSLAAVALAAAWATSPDATGTALHFLLAVLALVCTGLRAAVLLFPRGARDGTALAALPPRDPPPVYSVLVALHREAAMAPSIVAAMKALDWPRSRLEVLFVCEANDPETVAAVERAIAGEANFTVIATPGSYPQTKPKALNFALPLARGEFVVLYDAEDRPHPGQLREAFERFRRSEPELACLQAPLEVRDGGRSWWSAHFATEYAILFRAVLPWLASHGLPVPLGGTSNHFRRSVLVDVGGWDSHNVAEDADLGIRLSCSAPNHLRSNVTSNARRN